MPTRGRLGTCEFLSEDDRVRGSSKRAGGFFLRTNTKLCRYNMRLGVEIGPGSRTLRLASMMYYIIIGCLKIWASFIVLYYKYYIIYYNTYL